MRIAGPFIFLCFLLSVLFLQLTVTLLLPLPQPFLSLQLIHTHTLSLLHEKMSHTNVFCVLPPNMHMCTCKKNAYLTEKHAQCAVVTHPKWRAATSHHHVPSLYQCSRGFFVNRSPFSCPVRPPSQVCDSALSLYVCSCCCCSCCCCCCSCCVCAVLSCLCVARPLLGRPFTVGNSRHFLWVQSCKGYQLPPPALPTKDALQRISVAHALRQEVEVGADFFLVSVSFPFLFSFSFF